MATDMDHKAERLSREAGSRGLRGAAGGLRRRLSATRRRKVAATANSAAEGGDGSNEGGEAEGARRPAPSRLLSRSRRLGAKSERSKALADALGNPDSGRCANAAAAAAAGVLGVSSSSTIEDIDGAVALGGSVGLPLKHEHGQHHRSHAPPDSVSVSGGLPQLSAVEEASVPPDSRAGTASEDRADDALEHALDARGEVLSPPEGWQRRRSIRGMPRGSLEKTRNVGGWHGVFASSIATAPATARAPAAAVDTPPSRPPPVRTGADDGNDDGGGELGDEEGGGEGAHGHATAGRARRRVSFGE
jgi:hypothetical protein